jgi:hypothetical protein
MKTLPFPAAGLLAAGLALGVVGDALLRAPGAPGLNMLIWAAALGAVTVLVHARSGRRMSGEAAVFLTTGIVFAAGLAWRDSPALKLFALGCTAVAFALPAMRSGAAWIRRSGVAEYAAALIGTAAHTVSGAARTAAAIEWASVRAAGRDRAGWRHAAAVTRGVVLATPIIVVFLALLMGADAVFAEMVTDTLRIDVDELMSHVLLIGALAWIATGFLFGFLAGTRPAEQVTLRARATLGMTETATVLALLDLLFLAFVIVQFRYLFGGSSLVEVTPGLTYAEYARRGFFELVAVAALVLPLLLLTDWLMRREHPLADRIFRSLTGIQIVLILAITASAFQRMKLYQQTYGLTEQRVYVTAALILIIAILLWFSVTVLRGRRESFAFGGLLAGFATVAVLYVMNPDALIARTNIARLQSVAAGNVDFDVTYATSLSADAVPVLLAALPNVPAESRCRLAEGMLRRWPIEQKASFRTWSWSDARARRAVRAEATLLRQLARPGVGCPIAEG